MKKIINMSLVFFSIVILFPILNVKAYSGYEITKFDIDMIVNEDNSFEITETIGVYFDLSKHGIYRTIPVKNEIIREDGSKSKNRAKITDINVNNEYQILRENGNYKIQIGSIDRLVTGNQEYVIHYKYNIGNDKEDDFDEIYYNLIGTNWDTTIEKVTFRITMPKNFDESKLGFSAGSYGGIGTNNVSYEVNGNVITGSYNEIIYPGSALTMRLELPDGYFIKQKINILDNLLYYLLPIIFLVLTGLIWYKYGRDDQVIETVEFYPPEGLNSLEVGFLYKGIATNQDVVSLLIYLANKGYIKINEYEEKGLFSKTQSFKIIKVKDYDDNIEEERLFLNGLFANSSKNENGEEFVTKDDLYDRFYITMNKILNSVNSQEHKDKIYEKKPKFSFIIIIFYIITLFIAIAIPFTEYEDEFISAFLPLIFTGLDIFYLATIITDTSLKKSSKIGQGFMSIFFFIIIFMFIVQVLIECPEFIPVYIVNILCAFGIMLFYKLLSKRNKYGTEVLGKIKGFKTFLETAEKDKLETMVVENPTYFYDILPYTYVLGVSDTWIKKFETIAMQAPDWYYGGVAFDIIRFNRFIDNTMTVAAMSMTAKPSSSSSSVGGGFSGGGISGGGSGGGGGGSW